MNVQNVKINSIYNNKNKKKTTFTATPAKIIESFNKTMPEDAIKRYFLQVTTEVFSQFERVYKRGSDLIQKQKINLPEKFEYKLLEENSIPPEIANLRTDERNMSFRKFDEFLNDDYLNYDLSGTKQKVLLNQLLKEQGVERPDVLEFSK